MISCSIIPPCRRNYRAWLLGALMLVAGVAALGHPDDASRLDVGDSMDKCRLQRLEQQVERIELDLELVRDEYRSLQ